MTAITNVASHSLIFMNPEASCLVHYGPEALDPPMEFVGDAYKLKKVAKHSAALQALNYLEAGTLPCGHSLVISPCPSQRIHMRNVPMSPKLPPEELQSPENIRLATSKVSSDSLAAKFPIASCRHQHKILEG